MPCLCVARPLSPPRRWIHTGWLATVCLLLAGCQSTPPAPPPEPAPPPPPPVVIEVPAPAPVVVVPAEPVTPAPVVEPPPAAAPAPKPAPARKAAKPAPAPVAAKPEPRTDAQRLTLRELSRRAETCRLKQDLPCVIDAWTQVLAIDPANAQARTRRDAAQRLLDRLNRLPKGE